MKGNMYEALTKCTRYSVPFAVADGEDSTRTVEWDGCGLGHPLPRTEL